MVDYLLNDFKKTKNKLKWQRKKSKKPRKLRKRQRRKVEGAKSDNFSIF